MPTNLPEAQSDENHVAVSDGSEHVVQIKRLSRRIPHQLEHSFEHVTNVANSREFLQEEMSFAEATRKEVQPRRGTPLGASLFQEVGRQKRVTSILEVNAPRMSDSHSSVNRSTTAAVGHRQVEPNTTEIFESDGETMIIDSMHSERRSYKEVRSRKHHSEHAKMENSNVRYSNIFVPELTRKYKGKRLPWRHRSTGKSMKLVTANSFNCNAENVCVQHVCRRCNSNMSLNELKVTGRDQYHDGHPVFTCSLENLHQQHSRYGSQRNCMLCNRSTVSMADRRRYLQSHSTDSLTRRMYSSDAIYDMYMSNTILNRKADLLEIEYEEALSQQDLQAESYLTSEKLRIFVKVTYEAVLMEETDLDKASKALKLALDDKFGMKWHIVIGDDTFGSSVATLPGALVNFKHGKNVILAWQT